MTETDIIITQEFDHDKKTLWNVLTEANHMTQWFFKEITDFELRLGFKTEFNVKASSSDFYHLWEIIELEMHKKFTLSWKYKDIPGQGYVHFILDEKDETTLLTVINKGLESFPQTIPEFKRESCEAGWNYFIKERLAQYLSSI